MPDECPYCDQDWTECDCDLPEEESDEEEVPRSNRRQLMPIELL